MRQVLRWRTSGQLIQGCLIIYGMAVLLMALGSIICNKYDGIYDAVALVKYRPRMALLCLHWFLLSYLVEY